MFLIFAYLEWGQAPHRDFGVCFGVGRRRFLGVCPSERCACAYVRDEAGVDPCRTLHSQGQAQSSLDEKGGSLKSYSHSPYSVISHCFLLAALTKLLPSKKQPSKSGTPSVSEVKSACRTPRRHRLSSLFPFFLLFSPSVSPSPWVSVTFPSSLYILNASEQIASVVKLMLAVRRIMSLRF